MNNDNYYFGQSQDFFAAYALAQFAAAYSLIAQIGFYLNVGYGQVVYNLTKIFP